jgi:hypothetical protein
MKTLRVAAGFALLLGLTGCGGSDEDTAAKTVMPDVKGRQLDVALNDIKSAGFEDEVDVTGGGTFGIVDESNWKVCDQAPAAGQALKGAPRLTVDRSCGEGATESTTLSEPEAEEILTAANNGDLAALLAERDDCSDTIERFASTYRGRTIQFDGNIAAMSKHGDTDSRYDILVRPGDFSDSSAIGPNFQFRDVNISDLHLAGSNRPDSVGQGDNLHVTAEVENHDSGSCLFLLDPVSTEVR